MTFGLLAFLENDEVRRGTRKVRRVVPSITSATFQSAIILYHQHISKPIMEDQTAEINELFAVPNTTLERDVLGELKSILRIHSLSPQEMFFKWEAYSLKMGPETQMNYKTAREFKKDLQDALERESRGKAHMQSAQKRSTNGTPRNANTGDVFGV